MRDYLGLEDEKELKTLLVSQKFADAKRLVDIAWNQKKIDAFGLWKLLLESKADAAISFRKNHVMARDTVCTTYLCFKFCPNKLDEFLKTPILDSEKKELINESLAFGAEASDGEFCKALLTKGANISYKNYLTLRLACQTQGEKTLEGLREGGLDLKANSDYCFKHAFANSLTSRLQYLKEHLRQIPITNKETLDYLNSNNYESLKWLSKNIDYTINFSPEELIEDYHQKQGAKNPNERRILTKKVISIFGYFTLDRCLDYFQEIQNKELIELTQSTLRDKKNQKLVKKQLKRELNEFEEFKELL
jgi:hypothetical protein